MKLKKKRGLSKKCIEKSLGRKKPRRKDYEAIILRRKEPHPAKKRTARANLKGKRKPNKREKVLSDSRAIAPGEGGIAALNKKDRKERADVHHSINSRPPQKEREKGFKTSLQGKVRR